MKLYTLQTAAENAGLAKRLERAYALLRSTDFSGWETGRHDIDDDIFVLVQRYTTVPSSQARYEAHRRYADIQYLIGGEETIWWAPLAALEPDGAFDTERDIGFCHACEPHAVLRLRAGEMGVFLPCDAHMPSFHGDGEAPSQVKKVVVKVRV